MYFLCFNFHKLEFELERELERELASLELFCETLTPGDTVTAYHSTVTHCQAQRLRHPESDRMIPEYGPAVR